MGCNVTDYKFWCEDCDGRGYTSREPIESDTHIGYTSVLCGDCCAVGAIDENGSVYGPAGVWIHEGARRASGQDDKETK